MGFNLGRKKTAVVVFSRVRQWRVGPRPIREDTPDELGPYFNRVRFRDGDVPRTPLYEYLGDFLDEHAHGFTEVVAEFGGSGLGILDRVVENRRCQYGRIVDFADFHKDVCHGNGVFDIG